MRALPEADATEEPGAGDSLAKVNTHETVTEVMSPPDPAKTPANLQLGDDYTVTAWVMFGKVAGADLVGCTLTSPRTGTSITRSRRCSLIGLVFALLCSPSANRATRCSTAA